MEFVIGIDLGTTNCCVAIVEGDKPRVLEDEKGYAIQPSYVCAENPEAPVVGHAAKAQAISNPKNTLYGTKRFIGRKYSSKEVEAVRERVTYDIVAGESGVAMTSINGRQVSPTDVAAMILGNMRKIAERALQTKVTKAVVTVPAYFNHAQRKATIESGAKAGLEILRLVNEPTAAALAYGFKKGLDRNILVFDLGGGTFDVSMLEVGSDVFEVLVTNGDTFLGGNDFDNAIVEHLITFYQQKEGIDLTIDKVAMQRVKDAAEKAKCELSFTDRTTILLRNMPGGRTLQMDLNRETLERLCAPLVERCLDVVRKTLEEASLSPDEVDDVLLVGGQPRMPAIQKAITEMFGKPPSKGVHPDEAVAMGAAIHGHTLGGEASSILLLDVTPLSLGIDVAGDIFSPVIPKNSTVPVSDKRVFTTVRDDQSEVRIVVRQGEERRATDNSYLGDFLLEGIPSARRMEPKIEVTFRIDSNGLLHVAAKDQKTGERKSLAIQDFAELAATGGSRDPADFQASESDGDHESGEEEANSGDKKAGFFKRIASGISFKRRKATKAEEAPVEAPGEGVEDDAVDADLDEMFTAAQGTLPPVESPGLEELEELSGDAVLEDFSEDSEPITRELPQMSAQSEPSPADEVSTRDLPAQKPKETPFDEDYGDDPTNDLNTVELPRLEDLNPMDIAAEEAEISGIGSPFGEVPSSQTSTSSLQADPFTAPDSKATVGEAPGDPFDSEDLEAALGGWDLSEEAGLSLESEEDPAPPPIDNVQGENHKVSEGDFAALEEALVDLNFELPQGAEDFDVESLTLTGRSSPPTAPPVAESLADFAHEDHSTLDGEVLDILGDVDPDDIFAISDVDMLAVEEGAEAFGIQAADGGEPTAVNFAIAEKQLPSAEPEPYAVADKSAQPAPIDSLAEDPFGLADKPEDDGDPFGLADRSDEDEDSAPDLFGLADKNEISDNPFDNPFDRDEGAEAEPFALAEKSEAEPVQDEADPFGLMTKDPSDPASEEDDDPFGLADRLEEEFGSGSQHPLDPFGLMDKDEEGEPVEFDEKDPFGLATKDGNEAPTFTFPQEDLDALTEENSEDDPFGLADKLEEQLAGSQDDPFGLADKLDDGPGAFADDDPFGMADREGASVDDDDPFGLADRLGELAGEDDPFGLAAREGGPGHDENDPFGLADLDSEGAVVPDITDSFVLSEFDTASIDDTPGHTIRSKTNGFSASDWTSEPQGPVNARDDESSRSEEAAANPEAVAIQSK